MTAQHDVITAHIAKWNTRFIEPIVFGTTDPYQIAKLIDAFCQKELGAAVANYIFYEASQGAVCGLKPSETSYPEGSCRALLAQHKLSSK